MFAGRRRRGLSRIKAGAPARACRLPLPAVWRWTARSPWLAAGTTARTRVDPAGSASRRREQHRGALERTAAHRLHGFVRLLQGEALHVRAHGDALQQPEEILAV